MPQQVLLRSAGRLQHMPSSFALESPTHLCGFGGRHWKRSREWQMNLDCPDGIAARLLGAMILSTHFRPIYKCWVGHQQKLFPPSYRDLRSCLWRLQRSHGVVHGQADGADETVTCFMCSASIIIFSWRNLCLLEHHSMRRLGHRRLYLYMPR